MNISNLSKLITENYKIKVNTENGGILSFVNPKDPYSMNWVEGKKTWGILSCYNSKHIETRMINNNFTSIYTTMSYLRCCFGMKDMMIFTKRHLS